MDWNRLTIDDQTTFDCPVCGKSLIPEMDICEHVEFFYIDPPDDSSSYHYATDAFSSFLFLEILANEEMADEWLEDPSEDLICLAKAGLLGYRELPGVQPISELIRGYPNGTNLTVYEFEDTHSTYYGEVIIGVNPAGTNLENVDR